jgi:hypothetical protein
MRRGLFWIIPLVAVSWVPAQSPVSPAATKQNPPKNTTPPPKFEKALLANQELEGRVQALLPKDMKLESAAAGFKRQDLFLATLHAARNLDIPFDKLKADVTGTEHDSLGQAIRNYRPDLDLEQIESAAKMAEQQAKADVKETRAGAG